MKFVSIPLSLLILTSISAFSQAITLDPSQSSEILTVKKFGIGISHESSNGDVKFGTWVNNSSAYLQTHTNHAINFATNNDATAMTLSTSGNLGIGQFSPLERLHVNGSTILSESGGGTTDQVRIGRTAYDSEAKVSIANTSFPYGLKVDGNGVLVNGSSLFTGPVEFQSTVTFPSGGSISMGSLNLSGNLNSTAGASFGGVLVSNSLETGTISGPSGGPVNMNSNAVVNGDLAVIGTLSKSSGSFKIDHPLDPENKYLYHSFVESPDMMNVYNGNIHTDDEGNATVTLPDYFDALNIDFRYQLTAIGQFAQAIVLEEIAGNAFKIKTDKPNVKVSWQVTGVRNDTYAKENRVKVSVEKPVAEKGKLIYTSKLKSAL
jgi:hypothetical protein